MKAYITKKISKKGTSYCCLVVNEIIVSFDTMTLCKVGNLSPNVLSSLNVGDVIEV